MSLRAAVISVLAIALAFGVADTCFYAHHISTPKPLDLGLSVLTLVIGYLWYRRDSRERSYLGSVYLGGAIILIPLIGIPIYLCLSRQSGMRFAAVLRFFGLLVLAMTVSAIAPIVYDLAYSG